jgi:dolichyl-phosphate-mannose-protein mannosyltransferase
MKPDESNDRTRQEWLVVAIVTLIGASLRAWPLGRLGLTHFDEGIYALVASWSLHPRGIIALSPELISYAPPGYPILGGLAYLVLGRSDSSIILVSQLAGTLTIPVVAWLARRTFGPGAGFAAAVFCAFSGPHIAFSRMALTDASALLAWLIALGAGMRFLEQPGFLRALLMGLAVGLAQEFKYNGWLTGGIVVGTALFGIVIRPEERKLGLILKTFGWGGFAAVVAWLVVWPWYAFVEAHGGYAALLRHQQSYLGGFAAWWPNFLIQADQVVAMTDIRTWSVAVPLACLTIWIARPPSWVAASSGRPFLGRFAIPIMFGLMPILFFIAPYWLGLMMIPWLLSWPRPSVRLVGVSWVVLTLLTPFYHPYARLGLPGQATNWLLLGWLVANGFAAFRLGLPEPGLSREGLTEHRRRLARRFFWLILSACIGFMVFFSTLKRHARPQPDLLAPSDSLRQACDQISVLLPDDVKALQILARRPVPYYLLGRKPVSLMAGSDQLRNPGYPGVWALVDSAILRSEIGRGSEESSRNLLDRFANHWEVVQEIPTTLALPTLLDLDPEAARSSSPDRTCRLWLLRPRRPGAPR